MDMDISMDIHAKSVDMDMDMDMDGKIHIHGNPGASSQTSKLQFVVNDARDSCARDAKWSGNI